MSVLAEGQERCTLTDWLAYLETLHPKTIDMGLERVDQVWRELDLHPDFPIIIVGGTNGKGSVCTLLESILTCAGYKVGCYTSPHLLRYNERTRIHKQALDDGLLCRAFEHIDATRKNCNTSLTYFEFGTLAAMYLFVQDQIDVAILEVGMGGRLDAVNIFEPDCSIITSVDLDHIEFLGDTREKIGFEKAAIFRQGKPAICGDSNIPDSVQQQAQKIGADFYCFAKDFGFVRRAMQWEFWSSRGKRHALPWPALRGVKQLQNASVCLMAMDALAGVLPVSMNAIRQGLVEAVIPGRFQVYSTQPMIILDVAHNPGAALVLAENLSATKLAGRTFAVFAMLQDKDIASVIEIVKDNIDVWLIAAISSPRAVAVDDLRCIMVQSGIVNHQAIQSFPDCAAAFVYACERATKNDRICVLGSFYTVGDVLQHLNTL